MNKQITETPTEALETIQTLLDKSMGYDTEKFDINSPVREVTFDENSNLIAQDGAELLFKSSPVPLEMTEWAWKQTFSKLGPAVFGKGSAKSLPADYLLAIEASLRADLLNQHVKVAQDKTWLIRAYQDTCRAVLSSDYGRVGNTELLEMFLKVAEKQVTTDFKMIRSDVTPDKLNLKSVWVDTGKDDNRGGQYGIGVYVGNGEIGNHKVTVYPLVQRTSCTNSIIQKDSGISIVHRGSAAAIKVQVEAAMGQMFPKAAEVMEKMIIAHEQELPSFSNVLNGLSKEYGWDTETLLAVSAGTEQEETLAGVVNGVTYAAHKLHPEDVDKMVELETLGGDLLYSSDKFFSRMAKKGEKR